MSVKQKLIYGSCLILVIGSLPYIAAFVDQDNSQDCLQSCLNFSGYKMCPGNSAMTWGKCCSPSENCTSGFEGACSDQAKIESMRHWFCPFESYCGSSYLLTASTTSQTLSLSSSKFVATDICHYQIQFPEVSFLGDTILLQIEILSSASTEVYINVGKSYREIDSTTKVSQGQSLIVTKPQSAYVSAYATRFYSGSFKISYLYKRTYLTDDTGETTASEVDESLSANQTAGYISQVLDQEDKTYTNNKIMLVVLFSLLGALGVFLLGLILYRIKFRKVKAKLRQVEIAQISPSDKLNNTNAKLRAQPKKGNYLQSEGGVTQQNFEDNRNTYKTTLNILDQFEQEDSNQLGSSQFDKTEDFSHPHTKSLNKNKGGTMRSGLGNRSALPYFEKEELRDEGE